MRAATAARSRSRFDPDGKQWWLRLATNLPPPPPLVAKRTYATHTERTLDAHSKRPSSTGEIASRRSWRLSDKPSVQRLLPPLLRPLAPISSDNQPFIDPSKEIVPWRPILASLIPRAQSRMSARQAYILSSDLARWLLAERANLEPPKRLDAQQAREFIKALEALERRGSSKRLPAVIPDSSRNAAHAHYRIFRNLYSLPDADLGSYCHSLGSQHGEAGSDLCRALIGHFEDELSAAGIFEASHSSELELNAASRRRQIALQGLLAGLADRTTSDAPKAGSASQVRPHEALFHRRGGIESLIPPSQLLRIHNILCEDELQAARAHEQPMYHHLPPTVCYTLASLISISQRPQLFDVFYHLMQRVKSSQDTWSSCLSDPRELSFMLQYCTHSSVWREQGGAQLAQDIFRLLLSRPNFAQVMGEVEDETKELMPEETRRHVMIHLFAHLLLLRYATIAHLSRQAVQACCSTLEVFDWPKDESVTAKLIWKTHDSLLGEGKPSQLYQRLGIRRSVLASVRQLLVNYSDALAKSRTSYRQGEALERLCLYALHVWQPSAALDVLLSFVRSGAQLEHLVTPHTFIKLLNAMPSAAVRSALPIVSELSGINKGESLPREALLLDTPMQLRSSMVDALCRARLKRSAAALFLHWAQEDEPHRDALISDSDILATLVRHFAPPDAGHMRKEELIDAGDKAVLARKAPPWNPRESYSFCVELISALKHHKPLELCEHRDLTSLAPAYFYLGLYQDGFRVFNQLLKTRQVPSAEDLTVLVRALAVSNVEKAVELYSKYFFHRLRTDDAQLSTTPEEGPVPPPPKFTHSLRGDYIILHTLLERCFEAGKAIPAILRAARYHHFDESIAEGRSLALLIPILEQAWYGSASDAEAPGCDWPSMAEQIKTGQLATGSRWHFPRCIAKLLCEAAVNGTTVKQLIYRKQERAEYEHRRGQDAVAADTHKYRYRSTKSASPFFGNPHLLMSDADFSAALQVLVVMDKCVAAASMPIVDLFLSRMYTRAGMDDKCKGASDDESVTSSSRTHLSHLNKIVTVIRRMEARVTGDAIAGGETKHADDEVEQKSGGQLHPANISPTVMNPIIFRTLIRLYLRWGDVQGASEVFLWMKQWFAAGSFQSGRSRKSITGREAVKLGLGQKFTKELLEPVLGDLRILNSDQVPSWTFEGNKIERTKRWWTAGIRKK